MLEQIEEEEEEPERGEFDEQEEEEFELHSTPTGIEVAGSVIAELLGVGDKPGWADMVKNLMALFVRAIEEKGVVVITRDEFNERVMERVSEIIEGEGGET